MISDALKNVGKDKAVGLGYDVSGLRPERRNPARFPMT
jgi:hypothetical protein